MSRRLKALLLASVSGLAWQAQAGDVCWDFNTEMPSSNGVANLTAGAVSRGNGGSATLLTDVSASSGYLGASGGSNAVASAKGGVLSTNVSAYFQFTLTPAAGSVVSLTNVSLGLRSTSTGPLAFCLRGSSDGYASDLAGGSVGADSAWVLKSVALKFQSTVAGEPVSFRIYGYNGSGGSANWRIDDLTLGAAAVEPGTASPPVVTQVGPQTVRVGQTLVFALTVMPTDGDPVVATNGTADAGVTGAWSLAGGVVRYTPVAGDVGERAFAFTATDKDGDSEPMTVAVTVWRAQAPAVRMTTTAGTYAQDFNALATNGTAVLWDNAAEPLEAWYAYVNAAEVKTYRAGPGTATSGELYSFGASGATDRSLGSLASGENAYRFGVAFTNETGRAITNLSVRFTAEQWRAANGGTNTLAFDCCVTNRVVPLNQGVWLRVSALCFDSPVLTNAEQAAGAVYQSAELSAAVTSGIAPGEVALLRWTDVDDAGNDHAFGIDDLTVTWAAGAAPGIPKLCVISVK